MTTPTTTTTTLDDGVRESMTRLPGFFAAPLTLLTGQPAQGQRNTRHTAAGHLRNACVSIAFGVAVAVFATSRGFSPWLALLPVGWAMTLHGTRNLRMMIYHQCAHRNMWGRRLFDALLGRIVAALLMVQAFGRYSAEHVLDHHAVGHMTLRDPTTQAILVGLGLRAGMTRAEMWRIVLVKLVSPRFHARFLVARVRSYFAYAAPLDRVLTLAAYAAGTAIAVLTGAWPVMLLVWVLPMTLFFQVSNTLRLCVKHTFPAAGVRPSRSRDYFGSLTNAIFLGERAPAPELPRGRRTVAWLRWWSRMVFVHFPARYLVLTGDTVVHDYHHRHPMSRDWPNYLFAREADRAAGAPGWPLYRAVWGLVPAINAVFGSLRLADPDQYDPARLTEVSDREMFAAFDD